MATNQVSVKRGEKNSGVCCTIEVVSLDSFLEKRGFEAGLCIAVCFEIFDVVHFIGLLGACHKYSIQCQNSSRSLTNFSSGFFSLTRVLNGSNILFLE